MSVIPISQDIVALPPDYSPASILTLVHKLFFFFSIILFLFLSLQIVSGLAGFGAVRGMGSYGANNRTNEEASFSPPSRLNKFSSGPTSSPGLMSPIAEIDDKNMVATNQDSGGFGDSRANNYVPSFPVGSWDDSSIMSDNIAGLKRLRDEDVKPFSSETQVS